MPSRHAGPDDASRLCTILVEAFTADPVWAFLIPDPEVAGLAARPAHRGDAGRARRLPRCGGHTYVADDGAAALWSPPGIRVDEGSLVETVSRHADPATLEAAAGPFLEIGMWRPDEPHFYLHLLGASDAARGKGLGSMLLRRVTEVCDAEGWPAYLEASTRRSAALYERHGFEMQATIDFAPGVAVHPMLRRPNGRGLA
ncbi:MAG: GNAT family N-acetyltransferase [Acidimicrobiales bacterium]